MMAGRKIKTAAFEALFFCQPFFCFLLTNCCAEVTVKPQQPVKPERSFQMMNRYFHLALLSFALAAHAWAQGTPNVRVTWIGQSGFHIQTEGGPAVVSDPPAANFGFLFPTTPADAVTISHIHADHTGVGGVLGTPAMVDGRNVTERREVTAAGMTFTIIPGFHDTQGATRNSLITWTQGGLRFLQGGDYGQASLTEAQLNDLRNIDVAFIAASTPTLVPPQAKAFIDQLRP